MQALPSAAAAADGRGFRFRLIPRFETYPRVVAFVATPAGKLVNLALFTLGLYLYGRDWWLEAAILLGAISFLPQYRRVLVLTGTLYWLFGGDTSIVDNLIGPMRADRELLLVLRSPYFQSAITAAALLFCVAYYLTARTFASHGTLRRPVASLLCLFFVLMSVAWLLPLNGVTELVIWTFLAAVGNLLWFLGYALLDMRSKATPAIGWQLGFFQPFWMGGASQTPFGKGAGYLRKIEAKTPEQLAVCQIKATKLIYWAGILLAIKAMMLGLAPDYRGSPFAIPLPDIAGWPDTIYLRGQVNQLLSLDLPTQGDALRQFVLGTPYPIYVNWSVLVFSFLLDVLTMAIWGHAIIAVCRMAGFNALRNTYNPLASPTIAEFWNRYYYYFKELLVEFFFYPAFLQFFKGWPKLRIFFATLCAASFGNFLYHYFRDIDYIIYLGPWGAFTAYNVYLVYALVLGVAIGLSALRNQSHPIARMSTSRRVFGPFVVCGFFCLLMVFDNPHGSATLMDRVGYVLALFGIG